MADPVVTPDDTSRPDDGDGGTPRPDAIPDIRPKSSSFETVSITVVNRRRFLALTGALTTTTLAGCTSDDGQSTVDGGSTADDPATDTVGEDTSTGSSDASTDTPAETETDTETQTEEPTETASANAAIEIVSDELVVEEGEYSTDVYVAAEVTNSGEGRSGPIELVAEFYDGDGNYLDNTSQYLQTLGAGETWAARVPKLTNAEAVDDYELGGEFTEQAPAFSPEGLALEGSEMQVGEREAVVTGQIANDRGEAVSYLQAVGTIYDADGVVIGDEWTNVNDVPADRSWSFELTWLGQDRLGEADSHEVHFTDSVF